MEAYAIFNAMMRMARRFPVPFRQPKGRAINEAQAKINLARKAKSEASSALAYEWNKTHAASRQIRRRAIRTQAFNDITKKYPGEPRKIRRSMAFDYVRNTKRAA